MTWVSQVGFIPSRLIRASDGGGCPPNFWSCPPSGEKFRVPDRIFMGPVGWTRSVREFWWQYHQNPVNFDHVYEGLKFHIHGGYHPPCDGPSGRTSWGKFPGGTPPHDTEGSYNHRTARLLSLYPGPLIFEDPPQADEPTVFGPLVCNK